MKYKKLIKTRCHLSFIVIFDSLQYNEKQTCDISLGQNAKQCNQVKRKKKRKKKHMPFFFFLLWERKIKQARLNIAFINTTCFRPYSITVLRKITLQNFQLFPLHYCDALKTSLKPVSLKADGKARGRNGGNLNTSRQPIIKKERLKEY